MAQAQIRYITGGAALYAVMERLQVGTLDRIRDGGYSATGDLARSVGFDITEGPDNVSGTLSALDYWQFVGNGRGPGRCPPLSPLLRWVRAKGLASDDEQVERIARALQVKIGREGTAAHRKGGRNEFDLAIEDIQEDVDGVLDAHLQDIENATITQFNNSFRAA